MYASFFKISEFESFNCTLPSTTGYVFSYCKSCLKLIFGLNIRLFYCVLCHLLSQELQKAESIGPTLIWPAVGGQDFVLAEGTLTFDIGQRSAGLEVALTPNIGSSNPTPKRFRVALSDATGGARVHPEFGLANITLVSDSEAQAVWALLDQLHQPLDETIINRVLQGLINKVSKDITPEELTAVLDALSKVNK